MKKFLLQAACLAALGAAFASPASAIKCQGNFQVQANGMTFATPYCQDSNLAHVAMEKGVHVSANEIRNNPGEKARVCRTTGEDNRVRDTCERFLRHTSQ